MTTNEAPETAPEVYGQFGQVLAYAERTLSATLRQHLAQRDTEPETWYALKLTATGGPGFSRQTLCTELAGSPGMDLDASRALVSRLEADGLIHGDHPVRLTGSGEERFLNLRAHVLGATTRLLGELDLADVETTVRTLQAITRRALAPAAS